MAKKTLGKGLGALIRRYDLDPDEVKEAQKEAKEVKIDSINKNTPNQKGDTEVGRLTVYKKALLQAHDNGEISQDEEDMLKALRDHLLIDDIEHELLEEQVLKRISKNK